MKQHFPAGLTALAAAVCVLGAHAHHGTAGRYESELLEITGTVVSLMFINPHALLAVEVPDEQGNPVRWMAEFNNPPLMAEQGWHKEILQPGDKVTIIGLPLRNGAPGIRLSRGANGAKVIMTETGEEIFREEPPN
ncbi:MAG: DUF6152 family protein [Rhodospirillaceae bacterium]|nr:DUF6152 family protein [Rhodospirillaceae bacterium]MDD9999157.1 DUF6152 family protein [Rhodospirillaceae bacterium]MDE0361831.1 DUF6152 family protein [Rhodospirillaceae bacterium]